MSNSSSSSVPVDNKANHQFGNPNPQVAGNLRNPSGLFESDQQQKIIRQTIQDAEGTALFQRDLEKRLKNLDFMGDPRAYFSSIKKELRELGMFLATQQKAFREKLNSYGFDYEREKDLIDRYIAMMRDYIAYIDSSVNPVEIPNKVSVKSKR